MFARLPVPDALTRLALLQAAVVTREQCLGCGFSDAGIRRLLAAGYWRPVAPGVYFTLPAELPWSAQAWAGVLIGGDASRVGGLAAAHLHELVDVAPTEIEVLTPIGRQVSAHDGPWRFRRERSGVRGRSRGGPPRISVEDTVLDLCETPDTERAVHWVTSALQQRRTTTDRLRSAVNGRSRVAQRRLLTEILADAGDGVRSTLEWRYLHDVERAHGLPHGVRQRRRRDTEADVWYEAYALLVELDGLRNHVGEGAFRDLDRDNVAVVDGLSSLRYGHRDVVGRPCVVAFQVAAVLGDRGWLGPLLRCGRCRQVV